jgi:hypothetical protein
VSSCEREGAAFERGKAGLSLPIGLTGIWLVSGIGLYLLVIGLERVKRAASSMRIGPRIEAQALDKEQMHVEA